ncbi:hypothetical protein A3D88_01550 [Candidatus Peribacteria bacterium RIFCSPHIGHO2_02_FULL_52_16]|nr:MAG: hypothetical protein A2706_03790 [Candidatus Peribacteria bacterium RIFCSPHIGHO2_01_FULL_51_35]OGJ61005.1 MAG: hypothetical protein A3D88_01550 [Candidatus Peribacteria bacterium RIFCSPHIGHO2_02_FULL_52_16]
MQLPQFQVLAAIEERHWWFLGRQTIFRSLLQSIVPPHTGKKLIDVGCGTGGNTAAFASEYECIGIDPVPAAIAFAKERFPQCAFLTGMAPWDVPKEMHEADIVLLADVLEHVKEDRMLVADLVHAMKPRAILLMIAPADMKLWSPHDRGFDHYRRYDLESARFLWKNLPVTEHVCTYCNARLYWPIRIVRTLARFFGRSLGPADTDLSLPPAPINFLLRKIFESEAKRIVSKGFGHGVSFIALLQKN